MASDDTEGEGETRGGESAMTSASALDKKRKKSGSREEEEKRERGYLPRPSRVEEHAADADEGDLGEARDVGGEAPEAPEGRRRRVGEGVLPTVRVVRRVSD